jgi:hypothetical protein
VGKLGLFFNCEIFNFQNLIDGFFFVDLILFYLKISPGFDGSFDMKDLNLDWLIGIWIILSFYE